MHDPSYYRDKLSALYRAERLSAGLLMGIGLLTLAGAAASAWWGERSVTQGVALGLLGTGLPALLFGLQEWRRVRSRKRAEADILSLDPLLACRQEAEQLRPVLRFLLRRRQVEMLLFLLGFVLLLAGGVVRTNYFMAGMGLAVSPPSFVSTCFPLLRPVTPPPFSQGGGAHSPGNTPTPPAKGDKNHFPTCSNALSFLPGT